MGIISLVPFTLIVLFLILKFLNREQPRRNETQQSGNAASATMPPAAIPPHHPAAAALATYAKPETTPRDDLRAVASVLDTFRLLAKGDALPLGTNEEISAALRGETRAKLRLLPRDHPAFDAKGRIVDRWGTPLFFHAQSAKEIEVRSAGPDREMGTDDDILHGAR
jgi:hypothetical protein